MMRVVRGIIRVSVIGIGDAAIIVRYSEGSGSFYELHGSFAWVGSALADGILRQRQPFDRRTIPSAKADPTPASFRPSRAASPPLRPSQLCRTRARVCVDLIHICAQRLARDLSV